MSIAVSDPAPGGRLAAALRAAAGRSRRFLWRRPEWWALGLAAAAWAALVAADLAGHGAHGTHGAHAAGGAHGHHGHAMPGGGDAAAPGAAFLAAVLRDTAHWQLMVLAMMLPVIVPSLRTVAFRSLWRRRHRAVAGFLAGYLAAWGLAGLAVCVLLAAAPVPREWQAGAVAAAFVLAAGWQWTRLKRRALVACHRTMPLAPSGPRADRDCVAFGWRIGGSCCLGCWALMVACTLAGHSTLALAACGGIGLAERYSWRPNTKLLAAGILALALVFGPLGLGG